MDCKYEYSYYQIKHGEKILDVVYDKRVRLIDVKLLNKGVDLKNLVAGDIIKLPSKSCCCKKGSLYRIKRFESVFAIAIKHDVSIDDLLMANPYFDINAYIDGQVIIIPNSDYKKSVDESHYVIGDGENIVTICKKFDILPTKMFELNPDITPLEYVCGTRIKLY